MWSPDKVAEIDNCFILFVFIIYTTQYSYWCVSVTSHTQLSIRNQRVPLRCEIIQSFYCKEKALEVNYILNFSKENYVCECVIWWNDCHGKLNLTLKEISKNEKIIINSLCIKEFYFFTKEFFFSKFLIILIVYDTYTIYIWDLHIWDDINTYFYPYYILWT